MKNRLYYGDCLPLMREMRLSSVDLIYLDPPFNSNRSYNAIYRDSTGRELPDQVEAFCDIWKLTPEKDSIMKNMPVLLAQAGIDNSAAQLWKLWMNALRDTQPKLLAYLLYMTERLVIMKTILKSTGSIYLHCDPTASHYIKSLMDAIFGHKNFRNEIIWHYGKWTNAAKFYQKNHDTILFYSKTDKYVFNKISILTTDKKIKLDIGYQVNKPGGLKQLIVYDKRKAAKKIKEGNYDKIVYRDSADEGVALHDTWHDINIINSQAKERLGYPTQKPIALLKRIILASSNEGDTVFDPFCGCATTIVAAHELNRSWIGIDIAYHAIRRVVQVRLADNYGLVEDEHYSVDGYPRTFEAAKDLWLHDTYQFQRWAVEQVDGFVTAKKTNDGGIDGRIYFSSPNEKDLQVMKLEVKGGKHIGVSIIRELAGILANDCCAMVGLITMEPIKGRKLTNFQKEAYSAGELDVMGSKYPRMQFLSVPEIIEGKKFLTPFIAGRGSRQKTLPLLDMV